jgi:GtrA-like protein
VSLCPAHESTARWTSCRGEAGASGRFISRAEDICFVIDVGGFILLYHFGVIVLPASVMSFVAATLANYGRYRAFVFQAGRFARANEILRLFAVSAAGVALNSVGGSTYRQNYRRASDAGLNYEGRRRMVFHAGLPQWPLFAQAAGATSSSQEFDGAGEIKTVEP